jgi:hypothetical protein
MPVNPYYNHLQFNNVNEQELVEDLIIESIRNYGMDVYYIPMTNNKLDRLFGEDVLKSFETSYLMEMYFDTPAGFGGGNFLKLQGLQIGKETSFVVSAKRFTEELQTTPGEYVRPKEGDLIYAPLTKDLWEIKFADHEHIFYQLGKVYVWKLNVEKFQYSSETIDTGVDLIDSIMSGEDMLMGPTFSITLTNGGWGYTIAPTVNITGGGGTGATATATLTSGAVTSITIVTAGTGYTSTPIITFTNGVGDTTGHGASAKATLLGGTNTLDDSETIQDESDEFMDFNERDPFSMGGRY